MDLVVNGVEAFVGTGGRKFDPALPLVVFVHGAGLDHTVWALLARWFAHHGCGVLAPDLPGHGRSGGEPLASIGAIADWIAALIEASKADRADRDSPASCKARSSIRSIRNANAATKMCARTRRSV